MKVKTKQPSLFDPPPSASQAVPTSEIINRLVGERFNKGSEMALAMLQNTVEVLLIRDPKNRFDPNAIQVAVERRHFDEKDWDRLYAGGARYVRQALLLGHLKREGAAILAPKMDQIYADEIRGQIDTRNKVISYDISGHL